MLGFFSSLLLDDGTISLPAMVFYFPSCAYLTGKVLYWKAAKRRPCLSRLQQLAVHLYPFYGFAIFLVVCTLVRNLRQ